MRTQTSYVCNEFTPSDNTFNDIQLAKTQNMFVASSNLVYLIVIIVLPGINFFLCVMIANQYL